MLENLVLYQKIYDFTLWLYPIINRFPKSQRFVLGQKIENRLVEMLEAVASAAQERYKLPLVKKASADLEILRLFIRLACDLHFISVKTYGVAAERMNEIGRLIGGFLNQRGVVGRDRQVFSEDLPVLPNN